MKEKLEAMLDAIVNEDFETAESEFHNFVTTKLSQLIENDEKESMDDEKDDENQEDSDEDLDDESSDEDSSDEESSEDDLDDESSEDG